MNTVLITGGNRGIGFEVAKELLQRNFKVYLGSRKLSNGLGAVEKLREFGTEVHPLELDVSNEDNIIKAASEFKKQGSTLDVLINNAAILIDGKDKIDKLKSKIFNETISVNTLGPILVTQRFLPFIKSPGRIINVSSGYGSLEIMTDNPPAYSISKTALNAVTKLFAYKLKDKNISVNSVSPGWVRTDMGGSEAPRSLQEGAETIVWLANEAPINLTGRFLRDKNDLDW